MSKIIVIPLHIGDLIRDTYTLNPEEFGIYIRLIIAHYDKYQAGLPTDFIKLSKIVGCNMEGFEHILEEFFEEKDGTFFSEKNPK